jgi:hypothetical protein
MDLSGGHRLGIELVGGEDDRALTGGGIGGEAGAPLLRHVADLDLAVAVANRVVTPEGDRLPL